MADNKASFLWAIKQQESGGDYSTVNSSSGALGAYQIMPYHVGDWTQQALGRRLTATQYLNDPAAQDAVANVILGGYYDQYGAAGAAAMWYSGQPDPNKVLNPQPTPTIAQYVSQVISRMTTASPVSGTVNGDGNVQQAGLFGSFGSDLAQGLEQGLVATFVAVVKPLIQWTVWLFEAGLGFALIAGGAIIVVQQSPEGKKATKTAVAAVKTRFGGAAAAIPEPKEKKEKKEKAPSDFISEKQERQRKSREKAQTANAQESAQRRYDKARVAHAERSMRAARPKPVRKK